MGQKLPHWKFSRALWIVKFLEWVQDSQENKQELGIRLAFFASVSATEFTSLPILKIECVIFVVEVIKSARIGRSDQWPGLWTRSLVFAAVARTSLSVMKTGLWRFIAAASLATSNNADASTSIGCMIRRIAEKRYHSEYYVMEKWG
jgi:hypothetical protein